jgi:hypothetical protein
MCVQLWQQIFTDNDSTCIALLNQLKYILFAFHSAETKWGYDNTMFVCI